MSVNISDIRVFPNKNTKISIKANGDFVVGDTFRISFKVIQGKSGNFISFPQEKYEKDGETKYKNLVNFADPENKDLQNQVQKKLLDAYNKAVNGEESQVTPEAPAKKSAAKNLPF